MFSSRCARSLKRQKLVSLPTLFRYLQITNIWFSYTNICRSQIFGFLISIFIDHKYLVFLFTDHMKKHQRLAEAEMKKKALALELKRERELRRAKEDMYEDKRVIECKHIYGSLQILYF